MKKIVLYTIIIILLICIIILYRNDNVDIYVGELLNCDYIPKIYYEYDDKKIYTYCIDNIIIKKNSKQLELKEYLKNNNFSEIFNNLIETDKLFDGGTTIYKDKSQQNITIIKCNTLEGNQDIYIGNENMYFKNNFCKNNNNTFTKIYKITDIEEYIVEMENFVDYGKHQKVTIISKNGESATVVINNSWIELLENNNYEFEFMNYEFENESIENIFKYATVVEIRKSQ